MRDATSTSCAGASAGSGGTRPHPSEGNTDTLAAIAMRERILVIEDEPDIRTLLRDLLEEVGYEVRDVPSGRAGLRELFTAAPDAVILDITMRDLDGWQTLERIRDLSDVPVLILTARATEMEKVRGLKAGADDYVVKPFGHQELLARIEALLRRPDKQGQLPERYSDELLEVDFTDRSVRVAAREIRLTPLEFKLLAAFVRHPRQVLSREQLLELVWNDPYAVSRDQVRLYVGYLRKKLAAAHPGIAPIDTVRGFGYRYRPSAPGAE